MTFNLSEKIKFVKKESGNWKHVFYEKDIAEFIRLLKEEIEKRFGKHLHMPYMNDLIDRLAGEKFQ